MVVWNCIQGGTGPERTPIGSGQLKPGTGRSWPVQNRADSEPEPARDQAQFKGRLFWPKEKTFKATMGLRPIGPGIFIIRPILIFYGPSNNSIQPDQGCHWLEEVF